MLLLHCWVQRLAAWWRFVIGLSLRQTPVDANSDNSQLFGGGGQGNPQVTYALSAGFTVAIHDTDSCRYAALRV